MIVGATPSHFDSGVYGSAAWTPASLGSKLVGYYDASELATGTTNDYGTVDGSNFCSQLTDLSGNGYHATGVSNLPVFDTDRLDFVSANSKSLLISTSDSWVTGSTGEILIAYEDVLGAGDTSYLCTVSTSGDTDFRAIGFNSSNQIRIFGEGTNMNTDAVGRVAGSNHILSISSDDSSISVYYDGVAEPITSTNNGDWFEAGAFDQFSFFSVRDTSPAYYTGNLIGCIICNDQLTTAERSNAHNWLNSLI